MASLVHSEPLQVVLPTDEVTLKRHLGLFSGICFIIGIVIGVLRGAQSIGFCLVIWVACGLLSIVGIGSVHQRTGDISAYLFTWTKILILKRSSIGVLSLRNLWLSILLALPGVIVLYVLTNIS
ncbi:unnamed protein product [Rotaria magnacalcarata]|nr:unnamed protein product [Rotaria magnacalcarata]